MLKHLVISRLSHDHEKPNCCRRARPKRVVSSVDTQNRPLIDTAKPAIN
jgi:hypothetical protein